MIPLTDLLTLLDSAQPADVDRYLLDVRDHPELGNADGDQSLRAANHLSRSGLYPDLPTAAELAFRAHQTATEGAGIVFAELADKIAVMEGRAQPFGTLVVEQHGEMVQPPVDPAVSDEQRAEFGLPPLAQIVDAALRETRRRARERANAPEFPPGEPFVRVWTDPDPEALRARRAAEKSPAWADGDVLTFAIDATDPMLVTPVFPIPSWSVDKGLQALQVRVERLDEAVITYKFQPTSAQQPSFSRGSHDGRFRGPNAPAEAQSNDPLLGTLSDHIIDSASLGAPRTVTVYQPPAANPPPPSTGGMYPVVYATDGNMFAPYARRLDAAIANGVCPPVVVVAAHAAPADHRGNQRALEYLPGFDAQRFDSHQRFFVEDLASWAQSNLPVSTKRAHVAVWGCSDGGGHALATGIAHPARYGHIFGFSTGMPPDPQTQWPRDGGPGELAPFVHLCAGTLEGPFHQATQMWFYYLDRIGAGVHFTERVSGHDLIQWCEELPNAINRAFA